jgi:sugar/nucleoside kinase (ribokinase family)
VKVGKEGSIVKNGNSKFEIGIIPVKSLDTTGAGDLYASGFLYGLVNGYDLAKCGRIGAILAGKVIENIGPKIDEEGWLVVRKMIQSI